MRESVCMKLYMCMGVNIYVCMSMYVYECGKTLAMALIEMFRHIFASV